MECRGPQDALTLAAILQRGVFMCQIITTNVTTASSATASKRAATVFVRPERPPTVMMASLVPSIPATKALTHVTILPTMLYAITGYGATAPKFARAPLAAKSERPPTATMGWPVLSIPATKQRTRVTMLPIILRAPTVSSAMGQRFAI